MVRIRDLCGRRYPSFTLALSASLGFLIDRLLE
jgi:hypothetical protein